MAREETNEQSFKLRAHSVEVFCGYNEGAGVEAAKIRRITQSSTRTRAYLGAGGAFPPLISMLNSSDVEAQEAALLTLLNIAVRSVIFLSLFCWIDGFLVKFPASSQGVWLHLQHLR